MDAPIIPNQSGKAAPNSLVLITAKTWNTNSNRTPIATTPGTACSNAATILRRHRTADTMRKTRSTRNDRWTASASLDGVSVMATMMK